MNFASKKHFILLPLLPLMPKRLHFVLEFLVCLFLMLGFLEGGGELVPGTAKPGFLRWGLRVKLGKSTSPSYPAWPWAFLPS